MANAVLVQDNGSTDGHNTTDSTVAFTSAPTSGNVLVSCMVCTLTPNTFTAPTGWTLLFTDDGSGNRVAFAVAYKVSAGTETANLDWVASTGPGLNRQWCGEYSGLDSAVPFAHVISAQSSALSVSTGSTSATTQADTLALAFLVGDSAANFQTGRAWSNGFTTLYEDTGTTNPNVVMDVAYANFNAVQGSGIESTFSYTGTADSAMTAMVVFNVATASAAITSVGGDDVVLDAEANAAFVTTGFTSEISTVQLVSGTSITNATGVTSTSGTGDFDLPDITGYVVDTVGCPLTTANNVVVARLTDA